MTLMLLSMTKDHTRYFIYESFLCTLIRPLYDHLLVDERIRCSSCTPRLVWVYPNEGR